MGDRSKIEWSVSGGSGIDMSWAVVMHFGPVEIWLPWRTAKAVARAVSRQADTERRIEARNDRAAKQGRKRSRRRGR